MICAISHAQNCTCSKKNSYEKRDNCYTADQISTETCRQMAILSMPDIAKHSAHKVFCLKRLANSHACALSSTLSLDFKTLCLQSQLPTWPFAYIKYCLTTKTFVMSFYSYKKQQLNILTAITVIIIKR